MGKIFIDIDNDKAIQNLHILHNALTTALEYTLKEENLGLVKLQSLVNKLNTHLTKAQESSIELLTQIGRYIDFDLTEIQKRILNYFYLKKEGDPIDLKEFRNLFKIRKTDQNKILKPLLKKAYISQNIIKEKINDNWKEVKYLYITKKAINIIDNDNL